MPDWTSFEEMMKKLEPTRKAFGPTKLRAIPIFEDCVNYPTEQIVPLMKLAYKIEQSELNPETEANIRKFAALLDEIKPIKRPLLRQYLWSDGRMPTETEYTENVNFRYNHNPGFNPYLFEMLLPEDVRPKGAVIFCPGGDHGPATPGEGYQNALDFNAMGYQCFILLNRPNHNPWTSREAGVDAARAVRMVRANAGRYRIDRRNIAFAGFSNGGLTGEGLIEHFSGKQTVKDSFPSYIPDELDEVDATPDAFLCVYGPRFDGDNFDWENVVYPPTFFAVGREDSAMANLNYVYPDLLRHNVPTEIHTFAGVPHGKAGSKIAEGVEYPSFELWLPLADAFLMDTFKKKG